MNLELAEVLLAATGTLAVVVGSLHKWLNNREAKVVTALDDLQEQIDILKQNKVDEEDMKEYVQLWTKPITTSLDHLTAETTRTRELLEKIYHDSSK